MCPQEKCIFSKIAPFGKKRIFRENACCGKLGLTEMLPGKMLPGKMLPGKMLPGKCSPENASRINAPRKNAPRKSSPRKNGPGKNAPRKKFLKMIPSGKFILSGKMLLGRNVHRKMRSGKCSQAKKNHDLFSNFLESFRSISGVFQEKKF